MDKKMKKPYESPSTQCTLVEMEAGLCAASITKDDKSGVNGRINEHSLNKGFGGDFSESDWDTDPTSTSTN